MRELRGALELPEFMRAARQPAQHIFGAQDGEAQSRQRLRDQSAAAADIEKPQAGKGSSRLGVTPEMAGEPLGNEGESRRIETMKRPERAILVPPLRCDRSEAIDFAAIDR